MHTGSAQNVRKVWSSITYLVGTQNNSLPFFQAAFFHRPKKNKLDVSYMFCYLPGLGPLLLSTLGGEIVRELPTSKDVMHEVTGELTSEASCLPW